MDHYVGLDVSLKETHLCVMNGNGDVVSRSREVTEPSLLAAKIRSSCEHPSVVVLETGGQSSWLHRGLSEAGLPAVIVDARRAKAALSCRMNKTDANDAEGLAQLARSGWYREVCAKSHETQLARAVLTSRQALSQQRRTLQNVVRALLRTMGLAMGTVRKDAFEPRARELVENEPLLYDAVDPLLMVLRRIDAQLKELEANIKDLADTSSVCTRLMTVPGVGPMTALAFITSLDDPTRFRKSASVGAYLGLTPRRYQSGEVDWSGRISKQGDALARHMLFEAANVLLSRVKKWSAPKAWAARLVKRSGPKKARVALARKLAVILHRIWVDGSEFRWSTADAKP